MTAKPTKEEYFKKLYALREDSDEDNDLDNTTTFVDTPAKETVVNLNNNPSEISISLLPLQRTVSDSAHSTVQTLVNNHAISNMPVLAHAVSAPVPSSASMASRDVPHNIIQNMSQHDSEDSGNETDEPPAKRVKQMKGLFSGGKLQQDNFQCMKGGTISSSDLSGPNAAVIELMKEMLAVRERSADPKDHWKATQYKNSLSTLRRQETAITTYEQAIALPGIGDSLAKKIVEAAATGRLSHLEAALDEPTDATMLLFQGIYGVGKAQASRWIQQGHRTLQDLLDNVPLSSNQRMGITHYADLAIKIPRAEVEALGEVVIRTAAEIDPEVQVIIGGSYRRGASESGDVDFLITKPGTESSTEISPVLNELTRRLTASSFLVAALAVPHTEYGTKWHGCCVLPPPTTATATTASTNTASPLPSQPRPWRRIDFLLVPATELGGALIYFTGNDIFNRSLRLLAGKKGMSLNQRGLSKDVLRGPNRIKIADGVLVEGADERKIFEILGVPWREPWERIC